MCTLFGTASYRTIIQLYRICLNESFFQLFVVVFRFLFIPIVLEVHCFFLFGIGPITAGAVNVVVFLRFIHCFRVPPCKRSLLKRIKHAHLIIPIAPLLLLLICSCLLFMRVENVHSIPLCRYFSFKWVTFRRFISFLCCSKSKGTFDCYRDL